MILMGYQISPDERGGLCNADSGDRLLVVYCACGLTSPGRTTSGRFWTVAF